MALQEFAAYLGSILMFSTFWMKTMIPLRIAGIGANGTMLVYGALAGLYPVVALQALMLPVNVYRLVQMQRLIGRVALASQGDFRPDALVPFMTRKRYRAGEILFRVGDEPDAMYLIEEGRVRLPEIGRAPAGATDDAEARAPAQGRSAPAEEGGAIPPAVGRALGAGDIVGEIAIVSPRARRMATAVCETDVVLLRITPDKVRRLFYQNPDFGFFLIRLVTERLQGAEARGAPHSGAAPVSPEARP